MFPFLSVIPIIGQLFKTVDNVTSAIKDLQIAKVQAGTEKEKAEIQGRIDHLHAIQSALDSDNKAENKFNAYARFILFGLPTGAILFKLAFDKVVGSFTGCAGPIASTELVRLAECRIFRTDPIDPNMWWIILAVASFYLVALVKK